VAGGGVNDGCTRACPDGQVVQVVVVVHREGGDGLGLGLARLDVGGQDLVARLEVGDGDRCAEASSTLGGGAERFPIVAGETSFAPGAYIPVRSSLTLRSGNI
jgi:hypothetical protein